MGGDKKAELVFKLFTLHGSVRVCLCLTLPSLFVSRPTREGRQCLLCGLSVIRALCLPLGPFARCSYFWVLLSRIRPPASCLSAICLGAPGLLNQARRYVFMRNMVRIKPDSIQKVAGHGSRRVIMHCSLTPPPARRALNSGEGRRNVWRESW